MYDGFSRELQLAKLNVFHSRGESFTSGNFSAATSTLCATENISETHRAARLRERALFTERESSRNKLSRGIFQRNHACVIRRNYPPRIRRRSGPISCKSNGSRFITDSWKVYEALGRSFICVLRELNPATRSGLATKLTG